MGQLNSTVVQHPPRVLRQGKAHVRLVHVLVFLAQHQEDLFAYAEDGAAVHGFQSPLSRLRGT
jgi:hypothetical protein